MGNFILIWITSENRSFAYWVRHMFASVLFSGSEGQDAIIGFLPFFSFLNLLIVHIP